MTFLDAEGLTWEIMVELEPRLNILWLEARAVRTERNKYFCANTLWDAGRFKQRISRLAGFDAANPKLRNARASGIACIKIYAALSSCWNCGE